ncbi:MAG: HEPN/Toprim-associated domain-containing protein [Patescibacteria group bacterium]|nr:HEPN/Toprim-associated domain-containing protein [Patescibacteria group bacterium]
MGSIVTLGLGRLELDWGKNNFFRNHSGLFLPDDRRQVDYYYADDIVEAKVALARPLRSVMRRLEMLGYTLSGCEDVYAQAVATVPDYYDPPLLAFAEYAAVMKRVDVTKVTPPDDGDYDLGEYANAVIRDPEFTKSDPRLATLNSDDGTFLENLDPYVTLRLLAENPAHLDELVIWRIADIIEGGYASDSEIYEGPPAAAVCLVVTEGSSDTAVLRESLQRVAPDIADFFDFVDMRDNYPFTGTGNLFRFAQGLARIKIQNRILFVLDNDTAGHEALRRISALGLPRDMRAVTLPDLRECREFPTLGPSGSTKEDINGRAVSIELFLDLQAADSSERVVRWTSFNEAIGRYQGELLGKDAHVRRFLEAIRRQENYDCTKLERLWKHLVDACTKPAATP